MDNSAIIWSLEKGKGIQRLDDHKNFVQGVAWDPKNKYLITQSCDRSSIIYKNAKDKKDVKFFKSHNIKRSNFNLNCDNNEENMENNENSNFFIKEKSKSPNFYFFGDESQCPSYILAL